jgi:hypothetical protein
MNGARRAARVLIVTAVALMVAGGVGVVVAPMLNAFVLGKYNAYGEVPIPGSGRLHLPAGEVAVSLHVEVVSGPGGAGLPVSRIDLTVIPPPGVTDPKVTESYGSTTTVNNDTHRRVWLMQVPVEGDYQIKTGGQVGGYISPKLAFGTTSAHESLVWVFAAVFGIGLLDLICAMWWSRRVRRRPQRATTARPAPISSDAASRIEQLRMLAALRDSGALSEAEFTDEKRRILDGH